MRKHLGTGSMLSIFSWKCIITGPAWCKPSKLVPIGVRLVRICVDPMVRDSVDT